MSHKLLDRLLPGMPIVYGGNRITAVSDELASRFQAGDHLLVVQETGDLLHIAAADYDVACAAVARAYAAFEAMAQVSDAAIGRFFDLFAAHLESDAVWTAITQANEEDVPWAEEPPVKVELLSGRP